MLKLLKEAFNETSQAIFGLVSLVFLAPILSVMLLGLAYRRKEKKEDKDGE
jgi:amino acid transporter